MKFEEAFFIIASILVLLTLALLNKKTDWHKIGFKPNFILKGWWQILIFNFIIFVLVQIAITNNFIDLPEWMLDKDPLLPLIAITFIQEIIFRGLIISKLERWGQKRALWGSVFIFVLFHVVAPYTWTKTGLIFAGLTLSAGYFWGWHFLKFRNIYLLGISHFLVNLSFNYIILSIVLR